MQRTRHWNKEIKESLKKLSAVLVALLLLTNTLACTSVPAKRKIEIWLVDEKDMVLYRVISETKEQVLTIKDNPSMKNFMCIDKDEADHWIEEADRE